MVTICSYNAADLICCTARNCLMIIIWHFATTSNNIDYSSFNNTFFILVCILVCTTMALYDDHVTIQFHLIIWFYHPALWIYYSRNHLNLGTAAVLKEQTTDLICTLEAYKRYLLQKRLQLSRSVFKKENEVKFSPIKIKWTQVFKTLG